MWRLSPARLSFTCLFAATAALCLLATLPVTLTAQVGVTSELLGRATVIDGDTIEIRGDRIRLHGIDAPESGQWCLDGTAARYRCGQRAAFSLADKIEAANVRCELTGRDKYGRHVARCFLGTADLNDWMLRQGQAVAYPQYSTEYALVEAQARGKLIGLWQGAFDLPWHWRRGTRTGSAQSAAVASDQSPPSTDCAMKGNISQNGRIYHLPGQQHYDRTKISVENGERWFCSEDEARAAGWRRAKR